MKGAWFWPADPRMQGKIIRRIRNEDELVTIILAISKSPDGLSNAQVDNVMASNSQWRTLWHLKELMGVGLIEYKVQFFGEAGKYVLTDLGRELLPRIAGIPQQQQKQAGGH